MHQRAILVVGASNNPEKYGHKIVVNLKGRGFNVIPINPNEKEILGIKAFSSITDFIKANPKEEIELVDFVIPPKLTEKVLEEIKALKIKRVWLQPGSESEEAIKYCKENGINCTHHACVMVDYKP